MPAVAGAASSRGGASRRRKRASSSAGARRTAWGRSPPEITVSGARVCLPVGRARGGAPGGGGAAAGVSGMGRRGLPASRQGAGAAGRQERREDEKEREPGGHASDRTGRAGFDQAGQGGGGGRRAGG